MDCIIDDEECIESFKEDLDGDGPLLEEGEAAPPLLVVEEVKNWRRGEDRGDDDFMMMI